MLFLHNRLNYEFNLLWAIIYGILCDSNASDLISTRKNLLQILVQNVIRCNYNGMHSK